MLLCSSRYKYAAIQRGSGCFCSDEINETLKVNDSYCMRQCQGSRDGDVNGSCAGILRHSVYKLREGIRGLELEIPKEASLFSTVVFNASVIEKDEVEFRY